MSIVLSPRVSRTCLLLVLGLIVVFPVQTTWAEVRYFDGFGDGDRDNNGEVLGRTDVDMNRDALRCMMGIDPVCDPANGLGTSYTPPEFPSSSVTEISSVLDADDTGIRWLHSRGWSSVANPPRPPERDPKGLTAPGSPNRRCATGKSFTALPAGAHEVIFQDSRGNAPSYILPPLCG